MKIKVSDYIADFFVKKGVRTVFTVVGGGAMHLNDSFGHNPQIHCVYNHHEQASAMAAEAYFRVNNEVAGVCVTSGPGAINALNGVAGAYQDSIPMIVVSGQTKTNLTVRNSGLNLRALGNQEFDIVSALGNMTKYAEMVMHKEDIRYCMEKSYSIAVSGRPGPCWLDIPLDIQGAFVDTGSLRGYDSSENEVNADSGEKLLRSIDEVYRRLGTSRRPVIYAGNGIRISGAYQEFHKLVDRLRVPVVTCWDSIDLMETDDKFYAGRGGTMGDRAGNFAVQNSDFLLCIGTRLNIYQVGYDTNTWAREAYIVDVDIDPEELKKPTIRVDLPICADAGDFMTAMLNYKGEGPGSNYKKWTIICNEWKRRYPVVTERHYKAAGGVNVYAFLHMLSSMLPVDAVTTVANGSASVVGSQAYRIKGGQRFIMNCGLSSMGYDLPAAIGASLAAEDRPVICIAGDGSIQMNIQELQTIITYKPPLKVFVINNDGYHQIRQTQDNIFKNGLVGVGPDSGDLGFPDFEKLSWAYGFPYIKIRNNDELGQRIQEALEEKGCCICEVVCSKGQKFEPKSATKRLEDGTLVSPPLEDMAPFLSKEELKENMFIPLVEVGTWKS